MKLGKTDKPQISETRRFLNEVLKYIFDIRFLGVLGQIAFILLVVMSVRTIGGNFAENVHKLGESQFVCRDGSVSYRCAFDFMSSEAGFDMSDSVVEFNSTDSYWRAFYAAILNTIKVTILGVILMTILGTVVGVARLSKNWLISKTALWYVEVMRNTPILIQLFFIYFGLILTLPNVKDAIQVLGLPVFLSNRGLNFPALQFTASAPTFLAFLVLGIVQFQVVSIILKRIQERTGRKIHYIRYSFLSLFVIVAVGWYASNSFTDNQGFLVAKTARVQGLDDFERIVLARSGDNDLKNLEGLSKQELANVNINICVVRGSSAATNLIGHLNSLEIPFRILASNRIEQALKKYKDGACEVLAAPKTALAIGLVSLDDPEKHVVVSISESPVLVSVPTRQGFNYIGGAKMQPEFIALLIGLVLYNGAKLAEAVRAGIMSVDRGQSEAAVALGYNETQRLWYIVLPQALRVIIPPAIGYFLTLSKDTSLGIAVGFPDMYLIANTSMNQSGRVLQIFVLMMFVYMLISLTFSVLLNRYNDRMKMKEK